MFDAIESKFHPMAETLKNELKAELLSQQHRATGNLIDSIHVEVENFVDTISLVGYGQFYGPFVDRGRKPGVKKVPISALIEWIKAKGFETEEKKIRSMAFAVQRKTFDAGNRIFREPQYANFVNNVLARNKSKIRELIEKNFADVVFDYVRSQTKEVVEL